MTAPREDASALARLRALCDNPPIVTEIDLLSEVVVPIADLRALCALVEQGERTLQLLTDEQAAHKLTAETLAKAIRDGDKAEQYRVERDKAIQQGERDRRRVDWLAQELAHVKWDDVFPDLRPREADGEAVEKYISAETFWSHIDAAILRDAALQPNDSAARTGQEG